jgi:hypothetical protein
MVKPQSKKTVTRKASLASLPDIRTANDAADNPPVPPLLSDVTGQRRSSRNRTATSETFGIGDDSEHIRAGFAQSKDKAVRENDQLDDDDRDSNPRHRESLLTPIRGSDEVENSQMESPSIYKKKSGSSEHKGGDLHLLTLEEEVILVADRLRAIQGKARMDRAKSWSTNRPDSASQDNSRHQKNSDDNIREAMRNLHTPMRRKDERGT